MSLSISKPAVVSKTIRFLTAGGLTLGVAIVQEAVKADADWGLVATMAAGVLVGIGGGAYGRAVAPGPLSGVVAGR